MLRTGNRSWQPIDGLSSAHTLLCIIQLMSIHGIILIYTFLSFSVLLTLTLLM